MTKHEMLCVTRTLALHFRPSRSFQHDHIWSSSWQQAGPWPSHSSVRSSCHVEQCKGAASDPSVLLCFTVMLAATEDQAATGLGAKVNIWEGVAAWLHVLFQTVQKKKNDKHVYYHALPRYPYRKREEHIQMDTLFHSFHHLSCLVFLLQSKPWYPEHPPGHAGQLWALSHLVTFPYISATPSLS